MLRTPASNPRSGLTSLGLVLLALLVAGGLVYFLFASPSGRRSQAAERGPRQRTTSEASATPAGNDERGAPPVELVPAGTKTPSQTETTATSAAEASNATLAGSTAEELSLVASPGDGKVEGPALKYVRGEGKSEVIDGQAQRKERRAERRERAADAATTGNAAEKKAVEAPKKNGDRSQVKRAGSQVDKPEPRPKKDAPEDAPKDG